MLVYELVKKKRQGGVLTAQEIRELVHGFVEGTVPDYQMSAYLMAVFFRSMDTRELADWTRAMLQSGETLTFSGTGPYVDKHSTGGVGDKVSLPLAPLAACMGVKVPMISGRGLGHTGGTLDKLESIPGFDTRLSAFEFQRQVDEIGCAIVGQTDRLVPADRKLYALRDVTATVDSIPLIASSILSKKVASGISGLVMDVKVGSGAFMTTLEQARALAQTLDQLGTALGLTVKAYLTEMSQPLGVACGNALEVMESLEVLRGGGPADVRELVVEFAAAMAVVGRVESDIDVGRSRAAALLDSGAALERFGEMVRRQKGDSSVLDGAYGWTLARQTREFTLGQSGTVTSMDSQAIGQAIVALGGGRRRMEDRVDPGVGLLVHAKTGEGVGPSTPVATVYYNDDASLEQALLFLRKGWALGEAGCQPELIKEGREWN